MEVNVLVSTMFRENSSLISDMNIKTNAVIINQTNSENTQILNINGKSIKIINNRERGLSKSRNLAIENMTGDISIIADDDIKYMDDYEIKIKNMFKNNPDADIICFCAKATGRHNKKYLKKTKRLGYITSLKVTSFEIAFKNKSIIDNDITFDENFGTGSLKYKMGEENIFLYDCLKKGLKIVFVPEYILEVMDDESTWFEGHTDKYFFDKGAIYKRMANSMYFLLIIQFAIRKYGLYKNENTMFNAIRLMLDGARDYKKLMEG